MSMQLTELFSEFETLHAKHGSPKLNPIFGAGKIDNPKVCLVFMNPTSRNIASSKEWSGILAPWLGTKHVWKMLHTLGLFTNDKMLDEISNRKPKEWDEAFAEELYSEIASASIYVTNIAKCTQDDARPLPDSIFKEYLPSFNREISLINPEITFTFGNQVSSVILGRSISVSSYLSSEFEPLEIDGNSLKIYPTYYPVGQGMRNMGKATERIKTVLHS
ncbi:MAG: uracil-DNA glycosylase family protein [Candidatus Dojkabacteria bacterium]|nr:MAG: uracil-DNA glycosylase family protein [Candidatus Dojkabacteria bacterium]